MYVLLIIWPESVLAPFKASASPPYAYTISYLNQLLKRLNGQFIDRASAYEAAQQALDSFNAYVLNGTPRTVSGIKAKDFNYKYFMMTSAFWKQPLNFKKVVYETYKDHTFFVDWV